MTKVAVIDLGSNSFRIVIATVGANQQITQEFYDRDRVQLAAGLDENNRLNPRYMQKGFQTLKKFQQILSEHKPAKVKIVATNTLRVASNRDAFVKEGNELLGYPIDVISGREEARLIYMGVLSQLADKSQQNLVIDIGGGSTEFSVGKGKNVQAIASLPMGCVGLRKQFMTSETYQATEFKLAVAKVSEKLQELAKVYKQLGWQACYGCSGTIMATYDVIQSLFGPTTAITAEAMQGVYDYLLTLDKFEDLIAHGVQEDRADIFPSGFADLYAIFQAFELKEMNVSNVALREGALFELATELAQ